MESEQDLLYLEFTTGTYGISSATGKYKSASLHGKKSNQPASQNDLAFHCCLCLFSKLEKLNITEII